MVIYTYHEGKASVWWKQQRKKLARFKNLTVFHIEATGAEAMVKRTMSLQCSIQDGEMYLSDDELNVDVRVVVYS